MAKLYELDQRINELIANSIDSETGEVSDGFGRTQYGA